MKITFASICLTIDFDSIEDAENYKMKNHNKGWCFGEISKVDNNTYSMEVRRPYKNYNGGW